MSPYPLLITLYFIFFFFLTWRRFHWGLALLFFLLPTYLIRFRLGPLPTTMLEVMIWIVILVWLIKQLAINNYQFKKTITHYSLLITKYKYLFLASALFLTAATISVFTAVDIKAAAGEWKAFYIEPFLLFLVIITTGNKLTGESKKSITHYPLPITSLVNVILFTLIISGLATSLLAIYQHFTGWLVPAAFWENNNSYRVTSWYRFPNAVGLFLTPLVPLAIYLLYQSFVKIKDKKSACYELRVTSYVQFISSFLFLVSAPLAILFAKSTGALIGLAAGLVLLLLMWRRTLWPAVIIGLISLIGLISPISPFRQEVLLQDRSGQIRVAMWGEAVELLRARPILGAGLASYQERVKPYHTNVNGEGIEIFHHPHNIFLTMYVNLGLLGLIGFVWILVWFYKIGLSAISYPPAGEAGQLSAKSHNPYPVTHNTLIPFLLSSMTAVLIHGLVDSPYIKNDLAILFWLLPALLIVGTMPPTNCENHLPRPQ